MKYENGSKRFKTPYLGWLICCPIFAVWFFSGAIILTMQSDVGWAIYSLVFGAVWTFLFGFHFANHLNWKRTRKIQEDVLRDFKIIEEQLEKELEEEPFEDFKENKFTLDE